MRPALTTNGKVSLAASAVFLTVGTVTPAWPLFAMGLLLLSTLLVAFVLFVPQAAMFRRRGVEFAWWFPASELPSGAARPDQPVALCLLFRNRSPVAIASTELQFIHSPALEIERRDVPLRIALPAAREVQFRVDATARASGVWFLQGLVLRIEDRLGLLMTSAYFPNSLPIKVFPPLGPKPAAVNLRPRTGTSHEPSGPRLVRRRGLGSDLRELREHQPGDPFKHIAWRATARRGSLMVREFDSEIMVTRQILLDISPSMRRGEIGTQNLDAAIALCSLICRSAIADGDQVGLVVFDTRVYEQLHPADGPRQLRRVLDCLTGLHAVVDDDLTDLTDNELFSAIARYLAYQRGINLRYPSAPKPGAAEWDQLVVGVRGELIDRQALQGAVASYSQTTARPRPAATPHQPPVRAATAELCCLRAFCRDQGIALPYRRALSLARRKEDGFVDALTLVARGRGAQQIIVLSDLLDLEAAGPLLAAFKLAKRHRHQTTVILPAQVASRADPVDFEISRLIDAQQRREIVHSIKKLGTPVVEGSSWRPGHAISRDFRPTI